RQGVEPERREADTVMYQINMPVDVMERVKNAPGTLSVVEKLDSAGEYDPHIFPHSRRYPWNNDNFGPFTLPKKGATVKIDTSNICLYNRIIEVYDNNKLEIKNGKIFINDKETDSYTFKQDYYFM